jgi:hypothetical protein
MASAQTAASKVSAVDRTTLRGKLVVGYQGWFSCPEDPLGHWTHWMRGGHVTVDMLPDVSELDPSERCATPWTAADGKPIYLYSAQNPTTVDRHFAWMEQYGIEVVALQRFAEVLLAPRRKSELDTVLNNVKNSAERHGRSFYIEYDVTNVVDQAGVDSVVADWTEHEKSGLPHSPAYQQHNGRPVLEVFGIGFPGRYLAPALARQLVNRLREVSGPYGAITLIGGVPAGWRTLQKDAVPDASWSGVFRLFDILSPWTVGRFHDQVQADVFRRDMIEPDIAEAKRLHLEYMPVIFPGFSGHNLSEERGDRAKPLNQIPRDCGKFYWNQVHNAVAAGSTMMFNAMFDEVDEGTAMFKVVPNKAGLPSTPHFVSLDADGCKLPSDWYLRLAGAATNVVKGTSKNTKDIPVKLKMDADK